MMSVKLVVLAAVVATCCAKPFYFSAVPELRILRAGRSPNIAYGYGSGFASDIAGIKHSSSFGTSFKTGDGRASGGAVSSTDGGIFTQGFGYADANPAPVAYSTYPYAATPYYTYPYNVGYNNGYNNYRTPFRDSYGNTVATAQNVGRNGISNAYSQNGQFGNFATATNLNNPYQSRNSGSSVSAFSINTGRDSIAKSITQTYDGNGESRITVAGTENNDGAQGSTALTVGQSGGEMYHSGATTINGPGIEASHSYAGNTGAAGTFY